MTLLAALQDEQREQLISALTKLFEAVHIAGPAATLTDIRAELEDYLFTTFASASLELRPAVVLTKLAQRVADGTWAGLRSKILAHHRKLGTAWAVKIIEPGEVPSAGQILADVILSLPNLAPVPVERDKTPGATWNFVTKETHTADLDGEMVTIERISNPVYDPKTGATDPGWGTWGVKP